MALNQPSEPIAFFVPENPVPKGRPRVIGRRAITPVRTEQYENRFALEARAAVAGLLEEPIDGYVVVELQFVWARPVAMAPGPRAPRRGADIDNVIKAALDGIVKGGVVVDDDLVAHVSASKSYAATGEEPGVHITIYPLEA